MTCVHLWICWLLLLQSPVARFCGASLPKIRNAEWESATSSILLARHAGLNTAHGTQRHAASVSQLIGWICAKMHTTMSTSKHIWKQISQLATAGGASARSRAGLGFARVARTLLQQQGLDNGPSIERSWSKVSRSTEVMDNLWSDAEQAAQHTGDGAGPHQMQPLRPKDCHPDCSKRGNCNTADGRCECPFGLAGEACEQMVVPACRLVNTTLEEAEVAGQPLLLTCAQNSFRNCECLRQCRKLFCGASGSLQRCEVPMLEAQPCYEYWRLPPEQQVSVLPPTSNEEDYTYWLGFADDMTHKRVEVDRARFEGGGDTSEQQMDHRRKVLPLQSCPGNCSSRGLCMKDKYHHDKPYCTCYNGWQGRDCSNTARGLCPRDCSGRGTCHGGFCHCQPPYYGLGCGSHPLEPVQPVHQARDLTVKPKLRIYMYNLPPSVAYQDDPLPGWYTYDENYRAWMMFLERFLEDWSVRTEDPDEANLFYIPALNYHYSGNLNAAPVHMKNVISYVRDRFPYWDRSGGRDHFFWLPNDRGVCDAAFADGYFHAAIKVVHFGAYSTRPREDLQGVGYLLPAEQQPNPDTASYGCFHPNRDVVAVPFQEPLLAARTYSSNVGQAEWDQPKDVLLFFAGRIDHPVSNYSGDVRQKLHHLHNANQRPDEKLHIWEGFSEQYEQLRARAKFCLAPYGWGWGVRLLQIIHAGCVPVIIQDHVFQPFEDLLPYQDFSVRLPATDIPRIKQLLEGVTDDEWRRLRSNLRRYHKAFLWQPEYGGLAYNLTIASLRRRLASLNAGLSRVY